MHLDALRSTHPIHAEIRDVNAAGEAFDLITYEKGGAVLRMIEGYLGAERFRDDRRNDDVTGRVPSVARPGGHGLGSRTV